MRERIDIFYRSLATVLCFFIFGFGELLQALFVVPTLALLAPSLTRRHAMGKAIVRANFRAFRNFMQWVGVLTYEVHNMERLARPSLLIVANHPTLVDFVFILSFLEKTDTIVKGALVNNPFTRYGIETAGLIPNDITGQELVDRCVRSLEGGNSMVIFPEGGRSGTHDLLPFHRGAAQIALRARKPLTPVVIRVTEHNLGRGSRWWRAPRKIMHFNFEVHDDIPTEPYLTPPVELPLAARRLTADLRNYFKNSISDIHFDDATPIANKVVQL